MKKLLLPFLLIAVSLSAQPDIEWQKSLGGSEFEDAFSIQQTSEGGYIVAGYTYSQDGLVAENHGASDFWIVKLNGIGVIEWQKSLGGSNNEWSNAIRQTNDGGYIVAGFTESNDGDVLGYHGGKDAWVVKLSNIGTIIWQKALGGSGWDEVLSVKLTSDGGYILSGRTNSNNGDVSGNHSGSLDCWVVKLNDSGEIQWQKSLGGSDSETAYSIMETSEGGFILAGETKSNDGDVSGNHGDIDFWIVKLSNSGSIEWQKALGGIGSDIATSIHETANGFIACGYEASNNTGDVTGHHFLFDYWIVNLNKSGELLWQKALGGNDADWGYSSTLLSDNGYVVAGTSRSTDGDVLQNDGGQDIWLVELDNQGEIGWQKTLGGSKAESGNSIWSTSDGGLILAGRTSSDDGDVFGNNGNQDFWIVKLAPETSSAVEIPVNTVDLLEIFPNPASQSLTIKTPSDEPTLEIRIYDLLGRQILFQNVLNGGDVDISTMRNGLYLVAIQDVSGRIYTGKFLKI